MNKFNKDGMPIMSNGGLYVREVNSNGEYKQIGSFNSASIFGVRQNIDEILNAKSATLSFTKQLSPEESERLNNLFHNLSGYKVTYKTKEGKKVDKFLTVHQTGLLIATIKEFEKGLGRDIKKKEMNMLISEFVIYHKI